MARTVKPFWVLLLLAACGDDPAPIEVFSVTTAEVVQYDASFAEIRLVGSLNKNDNTALTEVSFHLTETCLDDSVGSGFHTDFSSQGLVVKIPSTGSQKIYAHSNTDTVCYFVMEYEPQFPEPLPPVLNSIFPPSPSKITRNPLVMGSVEGSESSVELYLDSACSVLAASGSSSTFEKIGLQITVGDNAETVLYAKSQEPFGKYSECQEIGRFVHDTRAPDPAVFVAAIPSSPGNSSTSPVISGYLETSGTRVVVFDDPACSNEVGKGTRDEWLSGIAVNVGYNTTTTLWALSFDELENASSCAYLMDYVHDITAPTAPSYSLATPASPTGSTVFPKIKGTVSSDTFWVRFYAENTCSHVIGFGSKAEFEGTGINVNIRSNDTTVIYAKAFDQAGNSSSACTQLTEYVHDTISPEPPVFSLTDPASPNNFSTTPLISGTGPMDINLISLYLDENCTGTVLVTGSLEDFESPGLQVTLPDNAISAIYGASFDLVGNKSICSLLTIYAHSTATPPSPVFTRTTPASPSKASTSPFVAGSTDSTITSIKLFIDSSCAVEMATGNRLTFLGTGIPVSVNSNAVTGIYTQVRDIYGNDTSCEHLTDYTHVNIPPLAPTFTSFTPGSPTNVTSTPLILGGAVDNPASILPTTRVSFFDSSVCTNQVGTGVIADFRSGGSGILLNLPANNNTAVYAMTFDAATNSSACTYMANYAHSNTPPGTPAFVSATPASPSFRQITSIKGSIGYSSDIMPIDRVELHSNSSCTTQIASGTSAQFTGSGISITAANNATTTIYAKIFDTVGNASPCQLMTNFVHRDVGPASLVATAQTNGSISLTWSPDTLSSPTPTYVVKRSLNSGGPYTIVASSLSGNNFIDLSIDGGTTYYYVVAATNNTGTSLNSSQASATSTPVGATAPLTLTATGGAARVMLSWAGSSTAIYYEVMRSLNSGGPYELLRTGLSSANYTDLAVTNGVVYYYIVRSYNPGGKSVISTEAAGVPRGAPAAPTGLKAVGLRQAPECGNQAGMLLTWSAPAYYESFSIERGEFSGATTPYDSTTETSFVDCDLTLEDGIQGTFYYNIKAVFGSISSAPSNEVAISSKSSLVLTVRPGNGHIYLTWNAVGGASAYQIFKATRTGGPYTLVATQPGSSYTDSAVTNGVGYYYYLVPEFNASVEYGIPSSEQSGVPHTNPSAPSNLVLTVDAGKPVLSWTAPTHYNKFNIYRSNSAGGPFSIYTTSITPTLTDYAPSVGRNYYRVTALWGTHETAQTNTVDFRHGAISNPLAYWSGPGQITVTWSTLAGIQDYEILRSTTSGGPYTSLTTQVTNTLIDTVPVSGQGYFYVIRSRFADGTVGQYSAEASAQAGTHIPGGLTVTGTTSSSVSLAWAKNLSATGFTVSRATAPGGPFSNPVNSLTSSVTVGSLNPNTTYYFRVTATITSETGPSDVVSALTVSAPGIPVTNVGNNQVQISWSPVSNIVSYTLQRSTDGVNFSNLVTGLTSPTYTDSSASNGSMYFYKVISVFASTERTGPSSTGVTPGITPPAPQGLSVISNVDGETLDLRWTGFSGATGYNIYSSAVTGGPYSIMQSSGGVTETSLVGLTPGQVYYFVLTSLNGLLESGYSAEFAFIPEVTPPAPSVVVNASAQVELSWSAVSGASTYSVLRSYDEFYFTQIASGVGTTTYTDTTVSSGYTYYYKIEPYNVDGIEMAKSSTSNAVTVGVQPLAPANLIGRATSTSNVVLNWVFSSQVASYEIYRGTATGGPYTKIASVASTVSTYSDSTVTPGNTYYYVVSALNASGVESPNSNEVGIELSTTPTGFAAVAATGQINLSWTAVGGASSYIIKRSYSTGGPYGVLATGIASTSYSDINVQHGVTYYYVVQAVFASGQLSLESSESSATGIQTMNLEVPIELVDSAMASSTSDVTFNRSATTIDSDAYDGTVNYYFEIVASNNDSSSRDVSLVDDGGIVRATVTVPSSTTAPTRLRGAFSPNAGTDTYLVKLEGSGASSDLAVYSARVLVQQSAASRTRIYIPLLAGSEVPSVNDLTAPIATTVGESYQALNESSIYKRDTTKLSTLESFNAWELEALVSTTGSAIGSIALYNTNDSAVVEDTEALFSNTSIAMTNSPFSEGVNYFSTSTEGDDYQLALTCWDHCSSGTVSVHKAGLWINLRDLSKAQTFYRLSKFNSLNSGAQDFVTDRVLFTLGLFSNPTIFFQAIATAPSAETSSVFLRDVNTQDQGVSGISTVSGSTLNFSSTTKTQTRSSAITLTTGHRLTVGGQTSNSTAAIRDTQLIVNTQR